MKMKEAERYTARGGLLAAALSLVVILYSLTGAVANADTINVNSTQSVTQINTTIANSQLGDTINFTVGTYHLGWGDSYRLLHDRDYTFDSITINGCGIEHGMTLWICDEGNVNISGSLTLQNSKYGIWIGDGSTPFDNISIRDVTFKVSEWGIVMDEIKHDSPMADAAADVSYCVFDGGEKAFMYNEASTTANSPYASLRHNTARDLTNRFMDVPKYWDGSTYIMLGEDEIYSNILINMPELSDIVYYIYYESPNDNGYLDVDDPYLGGEGNIILTEDDFYDLENLVPLIGSNADGKGAIPAAPEPTLLSLLALGGLALLRRRRK